MDVVVREQSSNKVATLITIRYKLITETDRNERSTQSMREREGDLFYYGPGNAASALQISSSWLEKVSDCLLCSVFFNTPGWKDVS